MDQAEVEKPLSDEEVFGPDAPKIDMSGVMSAIAALAREMRAISGEERKVMLDGIQRVLARPERPAQVIEVRHEPPPAAAPVTGWRFDVERDDGGNMKCIHATPVNGASHLGEGPMNSIEVASRAVRQ